ncbi:MAG: hypothetical protein DRJ42_02155 [Deltaproteobacteria bacterium]|nr:MAG: hypothetical protein DRJ42_02155 [Deltaproteobacteria bacterium]
MAADRQASTTLILSTAAFLAFVGALASAAPASAQDETVRAYVLAVPDSPELEPVAARVGAAARASLRSLSGVDWAGADRHFLGYSDYTYEHLAAAREKLETGRQHYLNLELPEAIAQLRSAVEDFDASAAALEDPSDLGEALLFLGASLVFEGQNRGASRIFARLHVQMPYLEPDANLFNPDIIQEYERAAPRDARNPQTSITVESEPSGAIVYVDYVARGRTPMTVDALAAGRHVVRVTRPGATPFVEAKTTRRRGNEQVNAFLEDNDGTPGLADATLGLRDHDLETLEDGDALHQIAEALEVDHIGVIQVSADSDDQVRLRFVMFDVATGEHSPALAGPVATAFGSLESGVQQLISQGLAVGLSEAAAASDDERIPAQGGGSTPIRGGGEDGPAFYETWWFWTIVGVVVIGGVTAGIIAAASGSGGQDLGQDPGGQVILTF